MTRSRLAASLALAAFLIPLSARADAPGFTPAQRQEIVAIVRQALKTDPSILRDAVVALRADEERRQAQGQESAIAAHAAQLTDARGDAVLGNAGGDVTLVEFYDPRCPYCRRMLPTVDQAVASDPKLRVVLKLIPILGPQSVLEAQAIAAAGRQGGYVAMEQALMGSSAPATTASIAATARALRLDPARLARDMQDPQVMAHLSDNVSLAKALGIDGTPAFVIGDTMVSGALDLAELRKAVSAARG